MFVNTFSMLSIELPFSFVKISFWRLPYSISVFCSISPLSFENLAIIPFKSSKPFSYSIYKLTAIDTINVLLASLDLNIAVIFSLENGLLGDHYSFSMFLLINNLTKIHSIIRFNNFKVLVLQ